MKKRQFKQAWITSILRPAAGWALLITAASCVPAEMATRPGAAAATHGGAAVASALPPAPPALVLQPVAPETAAAMNAAIPVADGYNPAASAFRLNSRSMADRLRSIDCLTQAIYYEAGSETEDGQRAVAQVVLNRVRHPSYPNSVCGVVYQGSERTSGCQFTFTCDGSLMRVPSTGGWMRARRIAAEALDGRVFAPVGLATHYHADYVLPYWASSLVKSAVIGAHIFYRWGGGWGQPAAFRQSYAGFEPVPHPRQFASAAPAASSGVLLQAELAAIRAAGNPNTYPAARIVGSAQAVQDDKLPKMVYRDSSLPESQVRDAYRYSGVPRDELPGSTAASGR